MEREIIAFIKRSDKMAAGVAQNDSPRSEAILSLAN
jgi:hypothetical protein